MQYRFRIPNGAGQENRNKIAGSSHNETGVDLGDHTTGPVTMHKYSIYEMIKMIEAIPHFDNIESEQVRVIARHMKVIHLNEKQQLFAEGEDSDYVCFIVSGTLEVFKQSQTGNMVSVSTLYHGRSIGEMALTDAFPRSATVIAQTPSTLLTITRNSFDQIVKDCPRAGVSLLKSLSRVLSLYLRRTSGQLADAREATGSVTPAPVLKNKASKESILIDHIINRKPATPTPRIRRLL